VQVECGNCGHTFEVPADEPDDPRTPCPSCGKTTRIVSMSATVTGKATVSAVGTVERGLNEMRLALLGILVGIGLAVGLGLPSSSWWVRLLAGVGSFVAAATLLKWRWSRHHLMNFMHWLTGQ
jgi:hypothetical protein